MSLKRADLAAAAALVVLETAAYRKVVRLWWVFDDTNLLRTIHDISIVDAYVSRKVWLQQLFTPLMFTAFEGEWALFGMNTDRWYVTHLVVACITAIAVYAALRMFVGVAAALAGAALFSLGTPLCSLVTQLSTVHYFIAITLCALLVIAWARGWVVLSALAYFTAMLAKEIAVPLPLLFLPARPRRIFPHAVALIAYLLWRRAVIGAYVGAYSWASELSEWPRLALLLPWKVARALAGPSVPLGMLLLALMIAVIAFAIRSRRALLLLLAGLAVAFIPLLPVAKNVHPRYAVMPWLALSVAFAICAPRRMRTVLLACAVLLAIAVNRQEWSKEFRERLRMSDEARFFIDIPPNGLLRRPMTPPPVIRDLNWLKTTHLNKPGGAMCFYDDLYLCTNDVAGRRVWEYEPSVRAVVEITSKIADIGKRHCSSIRQDAPLSARFRFEREVLHWDFGPYDDGQYGALIADGIEAWDLPRRDALNLHGLDRLELRVRYVSPQGWTTYSPAIALDLKTDGDVAWSRGTTHSP